jgi:hypothetical protein
VDPNTWEERFTPVPDWLKELSRYAGQFLAHPSYRRTKDDKPSEGWLKGVISEVKSLLDQFQASADKTTDWSLFASRAQFAWP